MTFEDWFGSNQYLLKSEGKDRQIFTAEDLEDAWNAAIEAVIYELGDQAYVDNYAYKSGDPQYAEDVAKKLLTK